MRGIPIRGSLLAIGTFVTGGLATDAIEGNELFTGWWKGAGQYQGIITLAVLIVFLIFFVLLYRYRNDFSSIHLYSLQQDSTVHPHKCLLCFVSPPIVTPVFGAADTGLQVGEIQLAGCNLSDDIQKLDGSKWRWQQMMRALLPHCENSVVKEVWLLGSADEGGSFAFLPSAVELLSRYCPWAAVRQYPVAVRFEDFNHLKYALEDIIRRLRVQGYGPEDIVVDVTGGQKTTSIAGAAVTLGSRVTFQYVQTSKPHGVLSFDLVVQQQASL